MAMKELVTSVGGFISEAASGAGYTLALLTHSTAQLLSAARPRQLRQVLHQMFVCGVASIPVTLVVSIFTGAILALNGGLTLSELGQEHLLGGIVAVSMTREMGPFMTGLILAASVGSGMAAELGTMQVSEEIDALEVMGIDPARFLVVPRLLAMAIMTPVVTVYTNLVGILGGALIGFYQYGVSLALFKNEALQSLKAKDIHTGLLKAFLFGAVIASVSCSQGLRARGGAIGVGHAVRRSVVVSYLLIIVIGYYVTFIFYRLTPP
jgi:phospholipid/cholesterol/gamma-HCH transport system permease protein